MLSSGTIPISITQFPPLYPNCDSSSVTPARDFGSAPRKQEQNPLNSTAGLKLGRSSLVAFDVSSENYRVSLIALPFQPHTLLFSCLCSN